MQIPRLVWEGSLADKTPPIQLLLRTVFQNPTIAIQILSLSFDGERTNRLWNGFSPPGLEPAVLTDILGYISDLDLQTRFPEPHDTDAMSMKGLIRGGGP